MRNWTRVFSSKIDERNEWIYYWTQLFHSLIFTIPIWIVYYQARITPAQISYLVTLQYVAQMVMELPSGALADLIGRRNTNFLGYIVGATGILLFPYAEAFWHFLVLAIMVGLMDSFRSGSEEALVYDSFKQVGKENRFNKVWANGNMVYQVGLITGTFLGGYLYDLHQHLPFYFYGVSLLTGSTLVMFYIEPKIDSEVFSLKNYFKQMTLGSKEAFKNQYAKLLSIYYIFVGGIAWSSTLYFNAYLMVELVVSDVWRGILTAGMRLINVVLIGSVLKNEKLFNWQRTVLFFPVIMLLAYLPGVFLDGFWGLPFVQAAMIATTARWIILSPLTNEVFSSKYRATAISVLSLIIGFVYIGLTSISSWIIPEFGIRVMYSVLGLVTLVTLVPATVKLLRVHELRSESRE